VVELNKNNWAINLPYAGLLKKFGFCFNTHPYDKISDDGIYSQNFFLFTEKTPFGFYRKIFCNGRPTILYKQIFPYSSDIGRDLFLWEATHTLKSKEITRLTLGSTAHASSNSLALKLSKMEGLSESCFLKGRIGPNKELSHCMTIPDHGKPHLSEKGIQTLEREGLSLFQHWYDTQKNASEETGSNFRVSCTKALVPKSIKAIRPRNAAELMEMDSFTFSVMLPSVASHICLARGSANQTTKARTPLFPILRKKGLLSTLRVLPTLA